MTDKLKVGETIAYDEAIIQCQLIPQDFRRFVGQLVLMDDEAVGAEKPSWLEVVQLERINSNGDITIYTDEGSQTISKHKLVKHSGSYIAFYAIKPEALNAPEILLEPVPESAVIVSEEYTKAVTLTKEAIAHILSAESSLIKAAKILFQVKEEGLYKELGYSNFDDYCDNEVKFKHSQATKLLAIYKRNPNPSRLGEWGIEKTYLLTMLDEPEREEILQKVDPNETSVKELKAEIKQLKAEKEQVQELENRPVDMHSEKDQAEIERLTAENNQLKIENEALEEQRDELEGKLFTMENDCQEGAVSDAEEKRFAEFTSAMNQQLVEETHRIHEEAQEEISRANLQRDNAFAEVTKLREQLALAQKPAVQESLSGSDGEFDAYFRMFDDALKHMTTYLFRKDCTDFLRRQSISMIETKFEKYISALKEERK